MNTSAIGKYAPQARKGFIQAVTDRAAVFGISNSRIDSATLDGQTLLIGGRAFPRNLAEPREKLVKRVQAHGFDQTMEAIAYTWFNRFAAIRYMELHGYLDHGYRVLSPSPLRGEGRPARHNLGDGGGEGPGQPEILEHAEQVDLPGLDHERVAELKLDGTKDEALYRLLLLAQCNALHQAMPFLFERIGDETELLLPANLLHTDSLIRRLVEQVDEALWQEIEIIGWLYQFYISEKKDQVIGKVVKSEDIPAATQLFTPNWIVKYMVQNSLGAQWLATYPQSPLKGKMEYYIEPAEQTPEVQLELAKAQREWLEEKRREWLVASGQWPERPEETLATSHSATSHYTLSPEHLTLIDPACGSGHILVEAYDLFKAIYLERGYRQRDVPQLILEKNLFGLDIDERAAQLTGFALMMKGRNDDRRLFERGVKLNVMALVDSGAVASGQWSVVSEQLERLAPGHSSLATEINELVDLFEHATTFGSLIQVPEGLAKKLPALKNLSKATNQDLFVSEALERLGPLVQQAELLAAQYDVVVANPPYMGGNAMNALVKNFTKDEFPDSRSDLFACFIERGYSLATGASHNAMVTMQSWMFLASFERMRERMLTEHTLTSMAHIGFNSFPSLNSKIALAAVFSLRMRPVAGFVGTFVDLNSAPQSADKKAVFLAQNHADRFQASAKELARIPGTPVAYWASSAVRTAFEAFPSLKEVAETCQGLSTADNGRFIRLWSEIDSQKAYLWNAGESHVRKWYPVDKGGGVRKWFGNNDSVINWENDGSELRALQPKSVIRNSENFFRAGVTWGKIAIIFSARLTRTGHIFSDAGMKAFTTSDSELTPLLGFLCSKVSQHCLGFISQTLNFEKGNVDKLPFKAAGSALIEKIVGSAESDWNSYERSWDFQSLPLLSG